MLRYKTKNKRDRDYPIYHRSSYPQQETCYSDPHMNEPALQYLAEPLASVTAAEGKRGVNDTLSGLLQPYVAVVMIVGDRFCLEKPIPSFNLHRYR